MDNIENGSKRQKEGSVLKSGRKEIISKIAAATIALQSFGHTGEPLRAAEVTAGMSWAGGLAALRDDANQAPTERAAEFILKKDGTSKWIGSNAGTDYSVIVDADRIKNTIAAEGEANIERECEFHTHPLKGAISLGIVPPDISNAENVLSFPPSSTDILTSGGTKTHPTFFAVMTPAGVWYYRYTTDQDYVQRPDIKTTLNDRTALTREWDKYVAAHTRSLSAEKIESIYNESSEDVRALRDAAVRAGMEDIFDSLSGGFIVQMLVELGSKAAVDAVVVDQAGKDVYESWINKVRDPRKADSDRLVELQKEYVRASVSSSVTPALEMQLQEAYLWHNGRVRFVPYDNLASEPACAGVD